ncbi:protein RESISTANCE TO PHYTOPHTHORA 1, chloroplastic-like [Lolium rigidum]|uniref:protein RESISTANCE TO PHYTOPHTHORA 1, chloroplastic-like n=1 Tax=Lolium rigidum TaxID=89674 RepID=UPI001F5D6253|nr:protein RESISTANCE TO PHYTOPHTHORA 1, chloroplastic-like [Lolium rigidum]
MHPLLNIPLSGGCAFPPVAAALRLPAASLPCRSAVSANRRRRPTLTRAGSDGSDGATAGAVTEGEGAEPSAEKPPPVVNPKIEKELKKAVQKTAATFAPRASTASKNPAVPGSTLYTIFEVQAYASMLAGGALSFNLVFPSSEPDIWRLMGMWSIWMFTIPSLRARDCSNKEKEALNYLFIVVPLINVIIPFFVKSFAVVWSADTVAFFLMYAWKLGWLQKTE